MALLGIAIVLCSIFFLALPAIAANQTDEPLDIYGNANEDDTIDMRDTTYIKLVIFGKKPKTDLADANYDGKVSMLDVGQTKLIILGKEKELTILDDPQWDDPARTAVTIKKPVQRVVVGARSEAEALRILDAADTIVGVDEDIITHEQFGEVYFRGLTKLPSVGFSKHRDYEAVLILNPDLFVGQADREKLPSIPVIKPRLSNPITCPGTERIRLLGYIFDKREEAEEYNIWHDDVINMIQERIESGIPDINDRPRVMYARMKEKGIQIHVESGGAEVLEMTLCRNVGDELPEPWTGGHPTVDTEWLLELNPDVAIVGAAIEPYKCGYGADDTSEIAATRERFMNEPVWAKISAVKEGRMYVTAQRCLTYSPCYIVGVAYYAKWIYPDLFKDFDPVAIHQEYVDFQGIDFNVREHGVFVYHPLE